MGSGEKADKVTDLGRRVVKLEEKCAGQMAVLDGLRAGQRDIAALFDCMHELVVYQDLEMRIVWANKAACDSVGATLDQLRGRHCFDVWHQRILPCEYCPVRRSRETLALEQNEIRSPDGRVWLIRGHPMLDADGRLAGMVETTVDITSLERGQNNLRQSQARYRQLYETAPVPYHTLSPEGMITDVNRKWSEVMGYSKEEVVGRFIFEFIAEDERAQGRASFEKKLFKDGFVGGNERHYRTKGGAVRTFVINDFVSHDALGNVASIHTTMEDVTDRKKTEQSLLEANMKLSAALVELKKVQQKVIQYERLSALGQMASGIAHDFNNTLMPILGYTDLLLKSPEILDNKSQVMDLLKDINDAAMDASQVVRRLRDFYRPPDKREHAPFNMNSLIGAAVRLTHPKWKEEMRARGIAITIKEELGDLPEVVGNESQLREALINFLLNAVDAMPEGGTITLRTYADTKWACIDITDTGVGMTEDVRRRCFEPFFSTKGLHGTGLGMAIAYGIIRQHDGTIDVASEPGKGTTITVRVPLHGVSARAEKPPVDPSRRLPPMKVLVVDDEQPSRDVVDRLLTAMGHTAEMAENGKEGLKKIEKGKFDLVIVDRAMPDMSGDVVAQKIKAANPHTAVVMLTGFADLLKKTGAIPHSVDVMVSKPATLEDLMSAMQLAVEKNRQTVRPAKVGARLVDTD